MDIEKNEHLYPFYKGQLVREGLKEKNRNKPN